MLRDIRAIRHHLDKDTSQIPIQALAMSKLDNCNCLLVGSVEYQLGKLQCIQNMACRVVCKLPKYDLISGYMADLHWLQVHEHIKYKLAVIMFRNKDNTTPIYIKELHPSKHNPDISDPQYQTTSHLPSEKHPWHKIPSFALAGPLIWNSLSLDLHNIISIKDFKVKCKTPLQGIIQYVTLFLSIYVMCKVL